MMDGRFFSGTRVEAYIADGQERFKKSNAKRDAVLAAADGQGWEEEGQAGEEATRLDKFGSWLEGEADGKAKG
jgi:HIV Tat-specific factor 1